MTNNSGSGQFPQLRLRRLRRTPTMRAMVGQVQVTPTDLIQPLFVKEGISEPVPISSMPGHVQHSLQSLKQEMQDLVELGVPAAIVFGVPAEKDAQGTAADDPSGISQQALQTMRGVAGDDMVVIADLCLCEYTDHGHCGVLDLPEGTDPKQVAKPQQVDVDNDRTLERYRSIAIAQADAGADWIAPSGMMDGQVRAIREALDGAGHQNVPILAYSAKYASAEYAPFREAAEGAPQFGDRRRYQMDLPNRREALAEVALDVAEGADMVMVKPALTYLDVIAAVRERFDIPVAAYHVSGEYSMVKAAAERKWIDGTRFMVEHLTAIKRAGADLILTYFAKEFAAWFQSQ